MSTKLSLLSWQTKSLKAYRPKIAWWEERVANASSPYNKRSANIYCLRPAGDGRTERAGARLRPMPPTPLSVWSTGTEEGGKVGRGGDAASSSNLRSIQATGLKFTLYYPLLLYNIFSPLKITIWNLLTPLWLILTNEPYINPLILTFRTTPGIKGFMFICIFFLIINLLLGYTS